MVFVAIPQINRNQVNRNQALDNAVSRLSTIAQNEGIAFLQLPKAERVAINQQQYQRLPDMTTTGNQSAMLSEGGNVN